ncbi:DUF927 domain-containing protein [Clostridium baratii]|uniref:DUF927 domain-containing protein n=1 Tax=Clostridium baratii TaxID=1561 RepID=UPI001C034F74|nr:DUF927 domain-containing protein [Clostridium baratii]
MNIDNTKEKLINSGYSITNDGKVISKNNKIITNTIPSIKKQITKRSSNKEEKYIEIGALTNGKILTPICIKTKELDNVKWVNEKWGLDVIVYPRMEKEFLLMLKEIDKDVKNEIVVDSIGWNNECGKYSYLFSNETIGDTNIRAEVDEHLRNYKLTSKRSKNLKKDCKKSLDLIHIVNKKISFVLLGLVYLSPLLEFIKLSTKLPEFVTWIYGSTGSGKTTLARQFLAHFGDFKNSLPASFNDTYSSIELKAHRVKDALMVLDDYCPQASYKESQAMDTTAEKIIRAVCDRVSRGRMNINLESQQQFIPRGMLLITGETLISGHSTVERLIPLEIKRNDINWDKMSKSQNDMEALSRCMRGYIEYLLEQANDDINSLSEIIVSNYNEYLKFFRENSAPSHGRTYEAFAWVATGLNIGMQFFRDIELITEDDISKYMEEALEKFLDIIYMKSSNVAENKPSKIFIESLKDIVSSSTISILNLDTREVTGSTKCIKGYCDSEYYYFNYSEIFSIVNQRLKNEKVYLPFNSRKMLKELTNDDVILKDSNGGNPKKVIIDEHGVKQRQRFLCVKKNFLEN